MDNVQNDEAMLQVRKEEEIRAEIITEYGFDETQDSERIDKLVAKQMESDKKLSDAIGQKIKHRNEAEELRKKVIEPPKEPSKEPPKGELSLKDIRALNSVHDDDVDFVTKWAKTNSLEIADAVKHKDVQLVLKGHEEERKTAEATNTGGGRPSPSKASDETLLSKAEKGDMPESAEEIERLVDAKRKAMAKR